MICLLQLSDLHIDTPNPPGAESTVRLELLQALLAQIQARWSGGKALDGVVLTGDLAQAGTPESYQLLRELFSNYPDWTIPLYCIAGNHDHLPAMQQFLVGGLWQMPAQVDLTPWRLIFLDTTQPLRVEGYLGPARLQALQAQLAATAPGCPTLIFMHHPPFAVGSLYMDRLALQDATAFWTILAPYPQVKAVVCGHVHQAFHGYYQGVQLLTAPSTNRQFKTSESAQLEVDTQQPGYRWLVLHETGFLETGIERLVF